MKTSEYEVLFGVYGPTIRRIIRRAVQRKWYTNQSMNQCEDMELVLVHWLYQNREKFDLENKGLLRHLINCRMNDAFRREFGRIGTHRISKSLWACQFDSVFTHEDSGRKIEPEDKHMSESEFEERFAMIADAVNELNNDERTIVIGIYFDREKLPEIARKLGIEYKAAYAIKRRAMNKIKTFLEA